MLCVTVKYWPFNVYKGIGMNSLKMLFTVNTCRWNDPMIYKVALKGF